MATYQQRSATCDRARAWISLRTDDELSEFECALLDAHLERCESCAAFAADLDSISLALRLEPLEQLTHPLDIAVRRRRRVHVPMRAVASAAALVVTIAGAATMLGSGGPQQAGSFSGDSGTADLRLQQLAQRDNLTAVFQDGKVKFVHPQGSKTKPAGGPVASQPPAQK
jgi:predicted anti-sigma-YlaC factor YlaD